MNSKINLAGKVALVTGAGSGIGLATAQRLAAEGAGVAVTDVDENSAHEVAGDIRKAGGRATAYRLDVSDRSAYQRTVAQVTSELGPIGILVNNAALGLPGRVVGLDPAMLQRAFDVNVKGTLYGMDIVGATMLEADGGSIVNIASMGAVMGIPGMAPYTTTKGAVISLTRSAAMELAPRIRVNAIAPGKIHTAFRKRMLGTDLTDDEAREIEARIPLQRIGMPGDVAAAVAFLASHDAAFITGIILPVDGGKTAGFHSPNA
jgi:NAD(P)-dependent dehydrogenase (short-subunit alcohol dehydrogenase family)